MPKRLRVSWSSVKCSLRAGRFVSFPLKRLSRPRKTGGNDAQPQHLNQTHSERERSHGRIGIHGIVGNGS